MFPNSSRERKLPKILTAQNFPGGVYDTTSSRHGRQAMVVCPNNPGLDCKYFPMSESNVDKVLIAATKLQQNLNRPYSKEEMHCQEWHFFLYQMIRQVEIANS